MHSISPFDKWLELYDSNEDEKSPFFQATYNEQFYEKTIYNYYIHPYWDDIESDTLFVKILFVDYGAHYAVIELIGEWNDVLHNDIMYLKRNVIDLLIKEGITKYILITENILNYFYDDDSYYEEWYEDISEADGWIQLINVQEHVAHEFLKSKSKYYVSVQSEEHYIDWRIMSAVKLFELIDSGQLKRLGA
ncbi:MAG: hypothetical protein WCP57_01130 [Bacteroidota bacterium]